MGKPKKNHGLGKGKPKWDIHRQQLWHFLWHISCTIIPGHKIHIHFTSFHMKLNYYHIKNNTSWMFPYHMYIHIHFSPSTSLLARDLNLMKRLLHPEEVCVRSFRGTQPPSPLSGSPLSLLDHSSSRLTFSRVLLLFFHSLPFRSLGWVLSSGEVRGLLPHNAARLQTPRLRSFIRIHLFE